MWVLVSVSGLVDVDVDVDVDLKDASRGGGVAVVGALKGSRAMSGWLPKSLFLLSLFSLLEEPKSAEVSGAKGLDRFSRPVFCRE